MFLPLYHNAVTYSQYTESGSASADLEGLQTVRAWPFQC